MSADFDLTFGVELEFIVVYNELAFVSCTDNLVSRIDDLLPLVSAGQAIEVCLHRAGIGAILEDEDEDVNSSLPPGERFARWTVTKDYCDLSRGEAAHLPPGFVEETVELSSRVFGFTDGDFHSELSRVLNVLNMMKREFGCEIFTNSTAGVHVHVGRRDGTVIPLQVCKRVYQLATAHERNIDTMHMASRVLAPESAEQYTSDLMPLYMPPSAIHRHNFVDSSDANVFQWLERLELVDSLHTLKELFAVSMHNRRTCGHRSAYNFDNLSAGLKNTVEFRQHAGTLDLVEICAWVSFVCRLVQYCHRTPDVQFLHLLCQATDMDFKLVDLLVALDVHADLLMHYNRDGGEALLGILPADNAHYTRNYFDNVIAQNDFEQEQNAASETVDEIIARKSTPTLASAVSYIGLIPSAGVVHCHEAEHLRQLLEMAYRQAQRLNHPSQGTSQPVLGHEVYCRGLVFDKLSSIYADQRHGAERAVQRHLADWQ